MLTNLLSLKNRLPVKSLLRNLDSLYDFALAGISGFDTAEELSQTYIARPGTMTQRVNLLIRWQNIKAGSSGFITGLGGFLTLPVAIPANLASVLLFKFA